MRRPALALTAAALAAPTAAAAADPVAIVRAYVRAVDRRDGREICRRFDARLRRALVDGSGFSCARWVVTRVPDSPDDLREFSSARVLQIGPASVEPNGITRVPLRTADTFTCRHRRSSCRATVHQVRDAAYLVGSLIVRPGRLLTDSQTDHLNGSSIDTYPPATPDSLSDPARFAQPAPGCASDVSSPGAIDRTGPAVSGLDVRRLTVGRAGSRMLCFTLELGGVPLADSTYEIGLAPLEAEGAPVVAAVDVDGVGGVHATPRVRAGLTGTRLGILVPAAAYLALGRFLIVAGAESLQSQDPLVPHPIQAGSLAPYGGCLVFPTGRIDRAGNCGETPSG